MKDCPMCKGSGKMASGKTCDECDGSGKVPDKKKPGGQFTLKKGKR